MACDQKKQKGKTMYKVIKVLCAVLPLVFGSQQACASDVAQESGEEKEIVILLHGIAHAPVNMAGVEYALKKAGYEVLNIGYPSRKQHIDDLAVYLHDTLDEKGVWKEEAYKRIHFTTHSMGGLVLRTYLDKYKEEIPKDRLGRVVMLGPPHGGSEVADFLESYALYEWFYGPAGLDLTTQVQEQIEANIYYDLGIIAGDKEWPYLVAAHVLPGKSDGRVAVKKTKINGMSDHITMSATHSFMSWKPAVHKQIIHFLENGVFSHDG